MNWIDKLFRKKQMPPSINKSSGIPLNAVISNNNGIPSWTTNGQQAILPNAITPQQSALSQQQAAMQANGNYWGQLQAQQNYQGGGSGGARQGGSIYIQAGGSAQGQAGYPYWTGINSIYQGAVLHPPRIQDQISYIPGLFTKPNMEFIYIDYDAQKVLVFESKEKLKDHILKLQFNKSFEDHLLD